MNGLVWRAIAIDRNCNFEDVKVQEISKSHGSNKRGKLYLCSLCSRHQSNCQWQSWSRELTCSWHQKTKPGIHQITNLKCYKKARYPFLNPFFVVYYFLFITLKTFLALLLILKASKDICSTLNLYIGELVVLFFWCHKQVNVWIFFQIVSITNFLTNFIKIPAFSFHYE